MGIIWTTTKFMSVNRAVNSGTDGTNNSLQFVVIRKECPTDHNSDLYRYMVRMPLLTSKQVCGKNSHDSQ
jgi:hypothetical protein